MTTGINLKERFEQIRLLRDSPALADRIAAQMLLENSEMTLAEAKVKSSEATQEYEKWLTDKQGGAA